MKNILFSRFNEEEQEGVIKEVQGRKMKYKGQEVIIPYNTKVSKIGIVYKGKIKIVRYNYAGDEVIQGILKEDEIFLESFVYSNIPVSVEVIAMKDSEILWIEKNELEESANKNPMIYSKIMSSLVELLANKNIRMNERNNLITQATLEDKIMEYLRDQVRRKGSTSFRIELKQEELASYLHCNRSALNSTLKRLKEEKKIEYEKQNYKLL